MEPTLKPDLNAIKARLGSLSPKTVARVCEVSPAVSTLLINLTELLRYVEALERLPPPAAGAAAPA